MCPRSREGGLHGFWQEVSSFDDPWSLQQAFHTLDRDGDGAIRSDDLSLFFGKCVGQSISPEEASSMIALADLDGDGAVGLEEFQQLMAGGGASLIQKQQKEAEQAALREVFDMLDVNKDGKIGREDLEHAMAMSGLPISEQELDAMVGVAARMKAPAGDGLQSTAVDFDAFSKFMGTFP